MRRTRAAILALLLATTTAALAPAPAAAKSDTRLRLDRALAEPSYFDGFVRLRLFATAVTLQGRFIPLTGKKAFQLKIGSSKKRVPYLVGAFGGTDERLAIAIVINRGFEYTGNFEEIKDAFEPFLASLPKDAKVSLISYADTVTTSGFVPPKMAARKIADLSAEAAPGDSVLIKAVERAVRKLDKIKFDETGGEARKFIILLSDGLDIDPEPKRFRKAGEKAAKKGIRIHSVAFSPTDTRRPLLGLGELSKRSFGTFRWVRGTGLFGAQFTALAAEVAKQYVLTFFLKPDEIDGKRVSLVAGDAESNKLKVKVGCGKESCGSRQYCVQARCVTRNDGGGGGIIAWILYIVGGLVGALFLLAFIGYLMSRRKPIPMPTPEGALAGPAEAPPVGADAPAARRASQRIVAYDAQGRALGAGAAASPAPAGAPPTHGQPALYIANGPGAGKTIPVAHGATIGTHPGCQVHLAGDGFASSVHAQILLDTAGNVSIVDKGSTNGTFVNGVRTQHHALAHGNTIKIGGVELRFLRN